jgi:hypothetical protein
MVVTDAPPVDATPEAAIAGMMLTTAMTMRTKMKSKA